MLEEQLKEAWNTMELQNKLEKKKKFEYAKKLTFSRYHNVFVMLAKEERKDARKYTIS